jgi:hypothetical protein
MKTISGKRMCQILDGKGNVWLVSPAVTMYMSGRAVTCESLFLYMATKISKSAYNGQS